jgi:hypothetical protein
VHHAIEGSACEDGVKLAVTYVLLTLAFIFYYHRTKTIPFPPYQFNQRIPYSLSPLRVALILDYLGNAHV